jgi:hypothetical protein
MGAMRSKYCDSNTYDAILESMQKARCVEGPFIAIGLKHPKETDSLLRPIWMFGEMHITSERIPPKKSMNPQLLIDLLTKLLRCDCEPNANFELFIESEEDLSYYDNILTHPKVGVRDEHGVLSTSTIVNVKHIARKLEKMICESSIHKMDWWYTERGICEQDSIVDFRKLINSAIVRMDGKALNVWNPFTPLKTYMFAFRDACIHFVNEQMYITMRPAVLEEIEDLMHNYGMGIAEKYPEKKVISSTVRSILNVLTDANAAQTMALQPCSVSISYWGAAHVMDQLKYLKLLGYQITHQFGNIDNDRPGYFIAT